MFDIREYYGDVRDEEDVRFEQSPAEIEEDISTDIDNPFRLSVCQGPFQERARYNRDTPPPVRLSG